MQGVAWADTDGLAPPPDEAAVSLPAVNVTAKGYAAAAVDTPMSTTVLTTDELARRQARNLGEALRGEPGLAVSSDSAQGQNPVIRGLKKDSVVLMVDGMRLNSAQPAGAVASFMSLGLAEQVGVGELLALAADLRACGVRQWALQECRTPGAPA